MPAPDTVQPDRSADSILRAPAVQARTGLSRSTIYRRMDDGTFPARVRLGPSCVGWYASDIVRWLNDPAGYSTH